MAGVFACPECGQELAVAGLSPGREVLCEGCSTWVEVPYLPRAGAARRPRSSGGRSPWNSPLLKGAIAFAAVALVALVATRMIGGRVRSDQERVLARLVASADEAEADRRHDVAYREIESALAHARTMRLEGSPRFVELEERRDKIVVREVEDRLAVVDTLGPDQAVGEATTLAVKVGQNPALAHLGETIDAKLVGLRLRRAEADLADARQAFDRGQDAPAFDAAARLHDHAADLSRSDADRFQAEALAILEAAVARTGVAVEPVSGRFVAGSAEAYDKVLDRSRIEILRSKGYLPEPRKSPWSALWDEKAPYRSTIAVVETQEDLYLQSKNRTTRVDGTFELSRGGRAIWTNRVIARTRVPLPDLPAMLGGHIATADKRNPDTERRLHADALKQFVEQSAKILKGMPGQDTATRIR